MSGIGWQDAAVALIVLGAAGYLVWSKLRARRSASPCGSCPGCAPPVSKPRQDEQRTAELPILRDAQRTAELPVLRITADTDR